MTIALTGAGGLFTRLGRIGKLASLVNQHQAALPAALESLYTQFDGPSPPGLRDYVALPISQTQSYIANQGNWLPAMQALAKNTLLRMVQLDTPAAASSTGAALAELIRQMKLSTSSVLASTVSNTIAALTGNSGTGQIVTSVKRPDGLSNEHIIPEVGRITCTADSFRSGAVAGNESLQYRGQIPTSTDPWAYDWPSGTGAVTGFTAISPTSGSLLTGGDFETFATANIPDGWTLAAGVAGTECVQEVATFYTGAGSVKLPGSATAVSLTQSIVPASSACYAAGLWLRLSAVPAAGVLAIDLIDGVNSIINDDSGVPNVISVSLPAQASGSWIPLSGVFLTPKALPAVVKLRIRLSTALSVGTNLYIDRAMMGPMTASYAGGPWLAALSGASPFALNDAWTATGANNRGGVATYNATFHALFDRLFGMRSLGLQLPSNAVPTIADTLITS